MGEISEVLQDRENAEDAYLREAIALVRRSVGAGTGGPFGALVMRRGRVLGRGWNRAIADHDPTLQIVGPSTASWLIGAQVSASLNRVR